MAQIPIKRYRSSGKPEALQITFTGSTTYTIDAKWKSMDVFVVGGGAGGSTGRAYGTEATFEVLGGAGAGYTLTEKDITLTSQEISVNIGNGGTRGNVQSAGTNGSASSITYNSSTTKTASGGIGGGSNIIGGNGGSGGGAGCSLRWDGRILGGMNGGSDGSNGGTQGSYLGGIGQGTTTRAFGEQDGALYAGGGAGGPNYNAGDSPGGGPGGGGDSGVWSYEWQPSTDQLTGKDGAPNTGGGGGNGGGWTIRNVGSGWGYAGNGAAGIVIIRLYKDSNRPEIEWNNNNMITIDGP